MINKASYFSICLIIFCMTAGCVVAKKAEQWEPVQPGQKSFVHIVKWSKENLAVISLWYTGSEKNEEKLADNNPNINPRQLIIGDRIFIPKDLLIKTEPITIEFIDRSVAGSEKAAPNPVVKSEKTEKIESKSVPEKPKKKKPARETEPAPEEEEDLDLFGPK